MPSLLVKVKAKMTLHAHEKVRGLLEGQYGSVFKGRSLDFDDLREYLPGDDIKDIDWRATARSGSTRIRRYVAVRKHNILLVVDTGRSMAATSEDGDSKRDVSVMIAGILSYIALKHGDLVGLVAGDSRSNYHLSFKGSNSHVEQLLQQIYKSTNLNSAPSRIANQLEYISQHLRRKMMLVIITDENEITEECQQVLRRLRAQHEIVWVTIGDYSGLNCNHESHDIDGLASLPYFIRKQGQIIQEFNNYRNQLRLSHTKTLDRLGIVSGYVSGDRNVISELFKILERQRHVK